MIVRLALTQVSPGAEPGCELAGTVAGTDLCKGARTDLRVSFGKQGRSAFLQPRNGMTMAAPNVLNPHPPEFERFLYASVGEDRNGYVVTVLSTLARLGLDPWKKPLTGRAGARRRASAVGNAACSISGRPHARKRSRQGRTRPEPAASGRPGVRHPEASCLDGGRRPPRHSGAIWAVLAIIFLLFQMFMVGGSGARRMTVSTQTTRTPVMRRTRPGRFRRANRAFSGTWRNTSGPVARQRAGDNSKPTPS
jgi:hypothetical protein